MDKMNLTFFEEYKKLENICGEIYHEKSGVSKYIEEMENTPEAISQNVTAWKETLKYLKKVRHIRNKLAHDSSFDERLCSKDDIDFLRGFCNKIKMGSDPLSLCRKMKKKKPQTKKAQVQKNQVKKPVSTQKKRTSAKQHQEANQNSSNLLLYVLLTILFALAFWAIATSITH